MMKWLIYSLIFLLINCANIQPKNKHDNAQIHYRLGSSYLREGKYALALKELLKAVKLDHKNPDIHLALGLAYMARGNLNLAEKEFKKILDLDKNYAAAYNNLGLLYLRKKKFKIAESYFKKALAIPTYPTPEAAYTNLGSCYLLQKDFSKARKNFILALELNHHYLPAYLGLARTWEEEGKYERAIAVYAEGITYLPDAPTLYFRMGLLYLKIGKIEQAKKQFEKVVQIDNGPLRKRAINILENLS